MLDNLAPYIKAYNHYQINTSFNVKVILIFIRQSEGIIVCISCDKCVKDLLDIKTFDEIKNNLITIKF